MQAVKALASLHIKFYADLPKPVLLNNVINIILNFVQAHFIDMLVKGKTFNNSLSLPMLIQ